MCVLISDTDLPIRLMRDELADCEIMAKWLSDPLVLEFYEGRDRPLSLEQVQPEYAPYIRGEQDVIPCLIILQSEPIGYVQFYLVGEESRKPYGLAADEGLESVYGIDQFIGQVSCWNRGHTIHLAAASVCLADKGSGQSYSRSSRDESASHPVL